MSAGFWPKAPGASPSQSRITFPGPADGAGADSAANARIGNSERKSRTRGDMAGTLNAQHRTLNAQVHLRDVAAPRRSRPQMNPNCTASGRLVRVISVIRGQMHGWKLSTKKSL